ncbi:MAG: hypothetical protein P8X65_02010 [Syntrophobacterales bacterium]|jgi:hypothetical protein
MASAKNNSATIRLTEVQARVLADWWGGSYKQVRDPEESGEFRHGVVFRQLHQEEQAVPQSPELVVFTLEEARSLENCRDAFNPGAPDWVG